jgi:aspartyl-tRNA(Asn)/glutamyl-tRNA(Gln) amidotransferase subunit A
MQVLAQPDARDSMSLPAQDIAWSSFDVGAEHLRGLRVGLLLDAGCGLAVDAEIRAAVEEAARLFERAGAVVEILQPFMSQAMLDGMDHLWRMRSLVDINALPAERRAKVLPYIRAWAEGGAALSGEQAFRGHAQMAALRDATVRATARFDAVLSPVSPVPAFAAERASPLDDPARPFEHIAFTLPFNMSEQPAIALDTSRPTDDGLPIGLQLAGRRHDDLGLLRLARAWERLRPPPQPWPLD